MAQGESVGVPAESLSVRMVSFPSPCSRGTSPPRSLLGGSAGSLLALILPGLLALHLGGVAACAGGMLLVAVGGTLTTACVLRLAFLS